MSTVLVVLVVLLEFVLVRLFISVFWFWWSCWSLLGCWFCSFGVVVLVESLVLVGLLVLWL